jgi:hypothetical protein
MQIQLTKTKTITIGGGGAKKAKAKKKSRRAIDVVGFDLFSGEARGVPAVRLTEKKGVLHVAAVGFLPAPQMDLPDSWEGASKTCAWSVPAAFQAPRAALAVTSFEMFLAQTTRDVFRADFMAGAHQEEAAPKAKRFSIRKSGEKSGEEEKGGEKEKEEKSAASAVEFDVTSGVPISNGGTRFVMKPLQDLNDFVMEAGLPEYQVLWISRLLAEGRRPTAASIQVRPSAILGSVLRQPAFIEAGGSAIVLFMSANAAHIAAYNEGNLVMWRSCRGAGGTMAIRAALKKELGLDDAMVNAVLEDTLIDPRPVLEPIIAPIVDELAVLRDYLVGKLGVEPKCCLLMGMSAGAKYFAAIADERAHLAVVAPNLFEGLPPTEHTFVGEGAVLEGGGANAFIGALGAALAMVGEER